MPISWIETGWLAASGMPFSSADIRSLREQGIRAILTLTEDPLTALPEIDPELLTALDICALHIPIPDDHPPTMAQAETILAHIREARQDERPLLIHCMMGIGRTGTALNLYYLAQGLLLAEARVQVKQKRRICARLSPSQDAFLERWAQRSTGQV